MHNTLRRESLELSAAIRLQEMFSEGSNDIEKHLATCSKTEMKLQVSDFVTLIRTDH